MKKRREEEERRGADVICYMTVDCCLTTQEDMKTLSLLNFENLRFGVRSSCSIGGRCRYGAD